MKKNILIKIIILILPALMLFMLLNFTGCSGRSASSQDASGNVFQWGDFTLSDIDGNQFTLSGLKGSTVVINFWATWCPPCRVEIPDFIEVYSQYRDRNVEFLGISAEAESVVRNFAEQYGINYPLLIDSGGAVFSQWKISSIPHTFIISPAGEITLNRVGVLNKNQLAGAIEKAME